MKEVTIIGGGAAGIMAAAFCAARGIAAHIYEKNNILGRKLYITGKGRCNVTNTGDLWDYMENIPGNPYFLYSALSFFDSGSLTALLSSLGLPTKVERGNRVYPESDLARDVVRALETLLRKRKVAVHTESPVEGILVSEDAAKGVILKDGREIPADGVILATGGLSYPKTGSTGDGYRMVKTLGHKVTKLYPSLVGLNAKEGFCAELMGLSLKNVGVSIKNPRGKTVYTDFGEMLFTHFGVSGPVILSASRALVPFAEGGYALSIDLKPALDESTLDDRLLRDFGKNLNRDFKNSLDELLPKKLIPVIISRSGIPPEKKVNSITKEERRGLVSLLKGFALMITGTAGFDEAVITAGGVAVKEIDPATMESKLIKNLHFAGEIIDVDGYTGGYNLQIAFSTGALAGEKILTHEGDQYDNLR